MSACITPPQHIEQSPAWKLHHGSCSAGVACCMPARLHVSCTPETGLCELHEAVPFMQYSRITGSASLAEWASRVRMAVANNAGPTIDFLVILYSSLFKITIHFSASTTIGTLRVLSPPRSTS